MKRRLRYLLATACVLLASLAGASESPRTPARIVSLGGDITETIYALNAQATLVGRDMTSTWPQAATALPDVGYVRQLGAEGVLALRPDLIIATHDAGPAATITQLTDAGVPIASLPATETPADIEAKIRRIGQLTGHVAEAEALASAVGGQFRALASAVQAMHWHPRVVFLMSTGQGSPMAAGSGTAADRILALTGAVNVAHAVAGYKPVSPEALVAMAPDAIVLMKEREGAVAGVDGVVAMPGVAGTPAGKTRRILFVEGQALLGFGPRTGAEALALQRQWPSGP